MTTSWPSRRCHAMRSRASVVIARPRADVRPVRAARGIERRCTASPREHARQDPFLDGVAVAATRAPRARVAATRPPSARATATATRDRHEERHQRVAPGHRAVEVEGGERCASRVDELRRAGAGTRQRARGAARAITYRSAGGTQTTSRPRAMPRTIASATASGVDRQRRGLHARGHLRVHEPGTHDHHVHAARPRATPRDPGSSRRRRPSTSRRRSSSAAHARRRPTTAARACRDPARAAARRAAP